MSEDQTSRDGQQRRQFGRKDSVRSAYASVSGGAPVACTVRNIAEGGALVDFGGATLPIRNFKLTIEDAPYVMMCEPRHQSGGSVGVRFLNHSDGVKLTAHLFPGPAIDGDGREGERRERGEIAVAVAPTSRELRQKVLQSIAERAASEPATVAGPQGIQQLPKQFWSSLTRAGTSTVASVSRPLKSALQGVVPSLRAGESERGTQASAGHDAPVSAEPTHTARTAPPLPDEAFRGYQPKRSRRNGIKGRSAGGIG